MYHLLTDNMHRTSTFGQLPHPQKTFPGARRWKLRFLGMLLLCLFLVGQAFGQTFTVSGVVRDDTGTGLAGVTVQLKGATTATATNSDGSYSLSVPSGSGTLVFTYIGFQTQEVAINDRSTLNVTLATDQQALDEVVVVGYGTQQKSQVTGAISSIKGASLAQTQAVDLSTALQGQASGVNVTSPTGAPGTEAVIRIRGIGTLNNSNPLFIIDGVPVTGGLNTISPNDIESIEVLKDAAASAIYGARAANGVVLVTTKSGKAGKNEIAVEATYGLASAIGLPEMVSTAEFIELQNEAFTNDGATTRNNDNAATLPNTDWLDATFRTAGIQRYNLSFSGGNDVTRYYLSGNLVNQEGTIQNSEFKRYGLRSNVSSTVRKWLTVGENLNLTYDYTKALGASGDGGRPGSLPGVVRYALLRPNAIPIYDPVTGFYTDLPPASLYQNSILYGDAKNPLAIADYRNRALDRYRAVGNIYAEVTFLDDFRLRTDAGLDFSLQEQQQYNGQIPGDRTTLTDKDKSLDKFRHRYYTLNWTNTLNYNHNFNEAHDVGFTLGTEYVTFVVDYLSAARNGYDNRTDANPDLQYLDFGLGQQFSSGVEEEWALMSYFGRVSYAFKEKYLLTANLRADASSRFSENNRTGYFPSVSVGWNLARENFMQNVTWLPDLKLRASWGQLGNQEIGLYPFATLYSTSNGVLQPISLGNPDVKWETTEQTNVGLDASLFQGMVNLSVDYFDKQSRDILIQLPASYTNGDATPPYVNGAKLSNKGWDFTLNYRQSTGGFSWDVTGNLTTVKNRVESLYQSKEQILSSGSGSVILREGLPLSAFYGYKTNGLFQTEEDVQAYVNTTGEQLQPNAQPGDIRFVDVNNDGKIDDADRTIIGDPNPDLLYSLNGTFSYKNFDLNLFFNGVYGNDIYNEVDNIINSFDARGFNVKRDFYEERWHGAGTSNSMPRATYQDPNNNRRSSDRYVESGSYLRLKNVVLGYTLPGSLMQRVGVTRARVYVSAQNLFTITDYGGMDPELYTNENLANYGDLGRGIDMGTYPQSRIYTFGLQLGF